jgi:hypothetical protein
VGRASPEVRISIVWPSVFVCAVAGVNLPEVGSEPPIREPAPGVDKADLRLVDAEPQPDAQVSHT